MTPQELKASILQLAIQGKLVEQRPEEGSGGELLRDILTQRRRVAESAEKKLTRRRGEKADSLPQREEIPDSEKPFDIPDSWVWVRLGEVASIERGSGIKRSETSQEGFPCVRYGEIYTSYGYSFKRTKSFVPESVAASCHTANRGDVLCTLTGEWKEEIAKATAYLGKEPIAIGGDLAKISSVAFNPILLVYFFFAPFMIQQKASKANGTMIVHIGKDAICNLLIPLPPLAEQKRIVAKIEELLPYIDRYEKAWSKLEDFNKRFPVDMQKSLLQMAIQGKLVEQRAEEGTAAELLEKILAAKNAKGAKKNSRAEPQSRREKKSSALSASPREEIPDDEKPFDIPESWEWVRLGEIATVLGGKRIPAGRQLTTENTGHIYIRVSDMKNDGVSTEHLMYVPSDIYPSISRYIITKEDVYITVAGTIGRVGKIPPELDGANLTENADRLVFESIDQEWLVQCLKSVVVQNQILDCTTKVGQPKLAIKRIQELIIPLPPLAEQKRIVAKLEELLPLCERLK